MPKRSKKFDFAGFLQNAILGFVVILLFYLVMAFAFSGIVYYLNLQGYLSSANYNSLTYLASLLPISLAVFLYLRTRKAMKFGNMPKALGFGSSNFSLKNVGVGLMIFGVILCLELAVALISTLTNVTINTNVAATFAGSPVWFLVFASIIEPINEEIFFRGFLVPRLGIIPSAVLFGLAHYSYDSTYGIEVIAAFIFGTIAGYVYKKTGSLYPGLVAHIMINSLAAFSIFGS